MDRDSAGDVPIRSSFVVVLTHSARGRIKEFPITLRTVSWILVALGCFLFSSAALAISFCNVTWRVIQYNRLGDMETQLRSRYEELQRQLNQHGDTVATLEAFPNELSYDYSFIPKTAQSSILQSPDSQAFTASLDAYNFLKKMTAFSRPQSVSKPSLWPINGVLTSSFGIRMDPFSGEGAYHTGIDLAAAKGTPVRVTDNGNVVKAGWETGYGNLIIVDHGGGIQTYYAHLKEIQVFVGERLICGQVIATVGGTGRSTGPHLHYEIRLSGRPVDPYPYLAKLPKEILAAQADLPLF